MWSMTVKCLSFFFGRPGFFPVDQVTIDYLRLSGRDEDRIALVEAYSKAQGMWRDATTPDPTLYPEYDNELRQAMLAETRLYLRELLAKNLPARNFIK